MNGRLADGTLIKNSPAVQKFLLSLALVRTRSAPSFRRRQRPAQGIKEELTEDRQGRQHEPRRLQQGLEAMQERERDLHQRCHEGRDHGRQGQLEAGGLKRRRLT
jgi:hypothetical protein